MKLLPTAFCAALLGAVALTAAPAAHAQVSLNVNIGQPAWGPAVSQGTQYYYIPEIDGYYDLYTQQYIVFRNGQWVPLAALSGYDPYRFNPVVIDYRGRQPWTYVSAHRDRFRATTYRPTGPRRSPAFNGANRPNSGNRPNTGNYGNPNSRPGGGNRPNGNYPANGGNGSRPNMGNQPNGGNGSRPNMGNQSAGSNRPGMGSQPSGGNGSRPGMGSQPSGGTQANPAGNQPNGGGRSGGGGNQASGSNQPSTGQGGGRGNGPGNH